MRDRAEILGDSTRYIDSNTLVPQDTDKLKLLTLEVLIDIRDHLSALTTILGSVEKIAYRAL